MTLYIESSIQRQVIAASATGTAHGRISRQRTSVLPRNSRSRSSAAIFPSTSAMRLEANVKSRVLARVLRKISLCVTATKLSRPTNEKLSVPMLYALRL